MKETANPPPRAALPSPPKQRPARRRPSPILRFSPSAWAKLHFFCRAGESEIGGFGISAPDDALFVEDFIAVRQFVTPVSVIFEDDAVADFFDDQVDRGRSPGQFGRIWCHTHPGRSPEPSGTDEETFDRVFGSCDWAVMFILAREGETYARLRFSAGPGGDLVIPVRVDYERPFGGSDHDAWRAEYAARVLEFEFPSMPAPHDNRDTDRYMFDAGEHLDVRGRYREPDDRGEGSVESFPCDDEPPWREVEERGPGADPVSPARRRRARRRNLDLDDGEVCP